MDKNYELFIEQLMNGIHGTIGISMENMEFARKGENFAEMGDRLLVKIMQHEDAWETCGLYTEDLFRSLPERIHSQGDFGRNPWRYSEVQESRCL